MSLLAAGTASGFCRVDVLWGRWFKDKLPYGGAEGIRMEEGSLSFLKRFFCLFLLIYCITLSLRDACICLYEVILPITLSILMLNLFVLIACICFSKENQIFK